MTSRRSGCWRSTRRHEGCGHDAACGRLDSRFAPAHAHKPGRRFLYLFVGLIVARGASVVARSVVPACCGRWGQPASPPAPHRPQARATVQASTAERQYVKGPTHLRPISPTPASTRAQRESRAQRARATTNAYHKPRPGERSDPGAGSTPTGWCPPGCSRWAAAR